MKLTSKFSAIKVLIGMLIMALTATVGFSYLIYKDAKKTKLILVNQKKALLEDLTKSKDYLELAIIESATLRKAFTREQVKVANLFNEIESATLSTTLLLEYKKRVTDLKVVIASLSLEKNELKRCHTLLTVQRDSSLIALTNTKKYNEELEKFNSDLNSTIKKGSRISVVNLKSISFKQSRSGLLQETDKARKVNLVQISFVVIGNKTCKPCNKEYYVQIVDSNQNIVGDRKTKKFGFTNLDYNYLAPVKFKNESMEVSADLALDKAEKGTYVVNVFDKAALASKTTFELK